MLRNLIGVLSKLTFGFLVNAAGNNRVHQKALQPALHPFSGPTLADHPPVDFFAQQTLKGHQFQDRQDRLTCDGVLQEYCQEPGHVYPRSEIGYFIDENRSMMKRMFGSVSSRNLMRKDEEDASMNSDLRKKRQAKPQQPLTTYLCPVEEELVTPFWALNGTGVKLAIVNTPPFEQAIHTVKCARGQPTGRCHPTRPCWCTQEYSWFRLLAYDPGDNCKGIFMDWFKFPAHCACKCVQGALQDAPAASPAPTF